MTIKKLINESFNDKKIQFIIMILISALLAIFTYWRTDSQAGDSFVKEQLKKCEDSLQHCSDARLTDIQRWGLKCDSLLVQIFEMKIEISRLKNDLKND